MLNQTFKSGDVLGWVPSFAPDFSAGTSAAFPADVPVMPATVLGLELLLQEQFIDLRLASELVLSDLGATLQVLRLIGTEYQYADERPSRMEECIASLDVEDWFAAVSAAPFKRDREHTAAEALWKHSRLIAQYGQLLAQSMASVCAEEAYLIGLLHELASIPIVLGWPAAAGGSRDAATTLAAEWLLPPFVVAELSDVRNLGAPSLWSSLLSGAHELAGSTTKFEATILDVTSPMLERIRAIVDVAERDAGMTPDFRGMHSVFFRSAGLPALLPDPWTKAVGPLQEALRR